MAVGRCGLIVRHGEIEADGHAAAHGLHGRLALGMGGKNTITNFFAVTEKETGKFGCVELGACFRESALQHLYEALSWVPRLDQLSCGMLVREGERSPPDRRGVW
jgi:hypothetical protein